MEGFAMFSAIFFILAMVTVFCIFISATVANKRKAELKPPVQYLTYNRQHFDRDFEFTCEYCGNKVSTKVPNCSKCGGSYDGNAEYKKRKKETNLNYLQFLKEQEELIGQEVAYIEKTLEALQKNIVMKNRFFNFELGEKPSYRPASDFEFTCEYCGTKLRGRSADEKTCPDCGADYSKNSDLLVMEAEEHLEKSHYEEYLKLKDIEWNQNIENEKKDAFLTKHGRVIAVLMIAAMLVIAFLVTVLIK